MTPPMNLTPADDTRRRKLIAYVERHDITYAEVAEKLGVSHQTVRAWACGNRRMRKKWLAKLLGIAVAEAA